MSSLIVPVSFSSPFVWGQSHYSLLESFSSFGKQLTRMQIVCRLSPLFILHKSHCIQAFNNVLLYYPALSLLPLWRHSLLVRGLLVIRKLLSRFSKRCRKASLWPEQIISQSLFTLAQIYCSIRSSLWNEFLLLTLTKAMAPGMFVWNV